MEEAEELLIKAWTTDNLNFKGKYWKVSFPSVRPRPYQKPHPPLARAVIQDESIKEMARIGRPILLRGNSINSVGDKIKLYRDTMASAGFDEEAVEKNLDQIWVWREMHLAETDDEALGDFLPAQHAAFSTMQEIRERWNPSELPVSVQSPPMDRSGYGDAPNPDAPENLVGSPKRVAEQVALMKDVGIRNLMLTNRGLMSREKTATSLKLLSEKVMPKFRDS